MLTRQVFESMEPRPRTWFEEWREPGEFYHAAAEGVRTFFCTDTTPPQYLREAYVVGVFGWIWRDDRGPCEVRLLAAGGFPDAQLRADGVHLNLEITMALAKDKEMFKEWRELRAKTKRGEIIPAESAEQRAAIAREAIPRVVGQKAAKRYAGSARPTLVVYSDDALALSDKEEMARLTEPWKDEFEAIYLLCGMDVVRTWPTLRILRGREPFWRPG
jgi:hypothetical protein